MARLVESSEFERALGSRSRARTAHFAVHHVPPVGEATTGRPDRNMAAELSTERDQEGASPVDDSCEDASHRLGAVVPKRHAKRAVTRSLLKRQIHAAGGRHGTTLARGVWVVRLRAPFERGQFVSAASTALRDAAKAELDQLFIAARGASS